MWDTSGDGAADVLFLSVDRTLWGPECGAWASTISTPDAEVSIR